MIFKLERTAKMYELFVCVCLTVAILHWVFSLGQAFATVIRESVIFIFAPMYTHQHKFLRNASGFSKKLSLDNNLVVFSYYLGHSIPRYIQVRPRRCAHSDYIALWQLHFQYGSERSRNRQTLTEHSVKVRSFLFPFTRGECTLIYFECVKVAFVRICRVFHGSQGQTQALFFSM